MKSPKYWIGLVALTLVVLGGIWLLTGGFDTLRMGRLVAQLGGPTATGPRGEAIESPAQRSAYGALVRSGLKAVPSLRKGLQGGNEWQRALSARALGQIRDRVAGPDLKQLLRHDPVARVRWEAADAVWKMYGPMAGPDLIVLLTDPEPWVRANAAEALGRIRAHSAIRPLAARLSDTASRGPEGGTVSEAAREALVRMGPSAVPDLTRIAGSPESLVRRRVAEALGGIGDHSSLPGLSGLSKDPDPAVRVAAIEAIKRIGASPRKRLPGKVANPMSWSP